MTSFICTMLLSMSMHSPAAAAVTNPLSVLQNPRVTAEETAAFAKYKNDPTASKQFIATRRYMRLLKASPKIPPPVPDDVQMEYTLNFDEQLDLYNAMLYWGIERGTFA